MKHIKKLISLLVVAVTVLTLSPAAYAQGISLAELFSKANEATQTVKSVDLKAELAIAIEQGGQKMNVANVKFDSELDLENVQGKAEFEVQSQIVTNGLGNKQEIQLKDNELATKDADGEWQKADYTAQREQLKTTVQAYMAGLAQSEGLTAEQEANLGQYFEVKEEGDEYVYALKQGIDGKKFYEDNKESFDRVKENAYKQAEAQGQTLTDAQKASYEKLLSAESVEKFFASNPKVEVHYNKSTFLVSKIVLDLNLNPADFLPAQSAQGIPGNISVQGNVSFDDYNQPVELENR